MAELLGTAVSTINYHLKLDRIREIHTSERRYYRKITDIYAECNYDYDRNSETTRLFTRPCRT